MHYRLTTMAGLMFSGENVAEEPMAADGLEVSTDSKDGIVESRPWMLDTCFPYMDREWQERRQIMATRIR